LSIHDAVVKNLEFYSILQIRKTAICLTFLGYLAYAVKPVIRAIRTQKAKEKIFGIEDFEDKQKAFFNFVLDKYVEIGVG